MLSIQQLQSLVASEISAMPIKATPADLYNPIKYALSLNAKRVRPAMVLLSCQAFGGNIADALKPAIGIELFHNFTLLHDDIMDNAPLRRKEPTVHTKWNNNVAILSGDAMFAKSFQYILMAPDFATQAVGNIFAETALSVCEGQQYDMDYEKAGTIKIDDYIQMISLKTAVLLAASLKIGAILAHASDNNSNHIFEFGRNMGIAFQLQDDILDVYADPKNLANK
jgi:geranylgeranyl diphosphate synthase type II